MIEWNDQTVNKEIMEISNFLLLYLMSSYSFNKKMKEEIHKTPISARWHDLLKKGRKKYWLVVFTTGLSYSRSPKTLFSKR